MGYACARAYPYLRPRLPVPPPAGGDMGGFWGQINGDWDRKIRLRRILSVFLSLILQEMANFAFL